MRSRLGIDAEAVYKIKKGNGIYVQEEAILLDPALPLARS
jgi:hypothetical protein